MSCSEFAMINLYFNLQAIIFLIAVFILFILYRILFRDRIFWQKFYHAGDANSAVKTFADKYTEKFRTSSLFKATLKILELEENELTHFENIGDKFSDFSELSDAIREAGLESSNVIIGVDFSASNEWQGRATFDRKSLHSLLKSKKNPYQQVITTLSTILEPFDDDKLIPVFGFGDATTKDKSVFSFRKDNSPCYGFQHVLQCYNEVVNSVELSGPTCFVPIIEKAIEITKQNNSYHILLIIADGQVEEEQDEYTRQIIIKASYYPISIIVVGVGDGPWDNMHVYDEKLPSRLFDNFQFVDYFDCIKKSNKGSELTFALHALMEIPDQYKKIKQLGMINKTFENDRTVLLETELKNVLTAPNSNNIRISSGKENQTHKRKLSSLLFSKK